jgi:hypothetical protein
MTKNGNGLGAGLFATGAVTECGIRHADYPVLRAATAAQGSLTDSKTRPTGSVTSLGRSDQCNHLYARSERMVRKLGE